MIILNLKLNNIYNFMGFELNLSYPKRIANSTIEGECLNGHPNFRYKKAIILMGSNATGKTCLGRAIKNACDFINEGNPALIASMVNDKKIEALVDLECVNGQDVLNEVVIRYFNSKVTLSILKAAIGERDSYETAHEKLQSVYEGIYSDEIESMVGKLDCKFAYSEIEKSLKTSGIDEHRFLEILRCVIGTLDPTLKDVAIAKDLKNSFVIRRGEDEIIIQDGKLLNRELLSSGTAEGIDISLFLALMKGKNASFYYCDEHFSYIQSEVEKRVFQIMLGNLKDGDQLVFTTHNVDMLDLNLPKHAFALLRRNERMETEVVFVSSLLKRNTDSVRCAVENDAFSSLPDLSLLDGLEAEDGE